MKSALIIAAATAMLVVGSAALFSQNIRVEIADGIVEGVPDGEGIHVFRGIPYAAPPVRDLRWRPPQPVEPWEGVRPADRFADQCMQQRVFDDMQFRNSGTSEDCLYLNVWTTSTEAPKPVLVYIYGGGFVAGDGSEPRYDGASMAKEGIVVVTLSHRLGIFGFFAHPELTAESPDGASGNYALLDLAAALRWVHENIAAFGGNPDRVTIAGESAGSFAVSALMASPLSRDLIAGAIGESGSLLGSRAPATLAEAEATGADFARRIGAESIQALRAVSALELLTTASRAGMPRFSTAVDGYFFPEPPADIYTSGDQAHVPLLVGWNSEEMNYRALLGPEDPTVENFENAVRSRYGADAEAVLEIYQAETDDDVEQVATDLAGDQFIGYSTWKWFDLHRRTGEAPVFRYLYAHPRPPMRAEFRGEAPGLFTGNAPTPRPPTGAVHSAEIEYALGNLDVNNLYEWAPDDYAVSRVMKGYFANFIKTGDPNGDDLPEWPGAAHRGPATMMRIEMNSRPEPAPHRRYEVLDQLTEE